MKFFFDTQDDIRKLLCVMLGSRQGRQLFNKFIDQKLLKSWWTNGQWLFFLFDSKANGFLKKLFDIYPSLIHMLDKDGNNPLLYVCLTVDGRRYLIIKLLIEIGCNQQIESFHGQTFNDILQLEKIVKY
ncbi:unnamed protein product [Adineta steineri]|uniref:Ankyrin repeat protein n=1 Tax=Adineta steineri TaxID=433720 RepID=A0A815N0T9_9BILA|nr:unnamed protein product [Adineta steineri]CAF1423297.1 unnamed protein product [Adineta steineri]CAF1441516.1 unnamed protein product [Adineta steineri]CAF3655916.1 unnamed protein product [Adineta steineri]CAF3997735.1 unnamed protein product [Adineta steineri]